MTRGDCERPCKNDAVLAKSWCDAFEHVNWFPRLEQTSDDSGRATLVLLALLQCRIFKYFVTTKRDIQGRSRTRFIRSQYIARATGSSMS